MEYKYNRGGPYEKGDEIRVFQNKLNVINEAFHGGWQKLTTDGIFGRNTRDAVKSFQRFMNMTLTGNLDNNTQMAINYKSQEALSSHFQARPFYGDTSYTPTLMEKFNQSAVRPTYEHIGVGYLVSDREFQSDHKDSSLDAFVNGLKSWGNSLISSIVSLFNSILEAKTVSYAATIVRENAAQLLQNFYRMKDDVLKKIGKMEGPSIWRWQDITYQLKQRAESRIEKATADVTKKVEASKSMKNAKSAGKVAGKAAWGLQVLVVIYYLGKCIFCGEDEYAENKKKLRESFDSLLGALMTSIIPKIVQIIVTRIATSAVVGSVGAPGVGTLVGAIVGVILTVVDLLLLWFTGGTIGDKIMAEVRKFVDSINWEEAVSKGVEMQTNAWKDPLSGIVSHNFL